MICPRCGSGETAKIIYGYPSFELFQRQERGEMVLGGCEPQPETWSCRNCSLLW
jgi:hypothetical protein